MNFVIRKFAIGGGDKTVPSSKADLDTLNDARDGLILALAIEEKFDIVIANFAELERDLLTVSLEDMIYREENRGLAGRDDRMLFNRRLSNLLSSARMYRDQVKADLNSTDAWKMLDMKQWVDGAMSKAAQDHVEFRACEALRNVTQHQETPVYSFVRQSKWTELGLCFTTVLIASLSAFSAKRAPNQNLEEDLWPVFAPEEEKKQPARVDDRTIVLMPIVRRYVEILAKIHAELREKLRTSIESWESFVKAQVDKAEPVLGAPVDLSPNVRRRTKGAHTIGLRAARCWKLPPERAPGGSSHAPHQRSSLP
jgi:hypothetical protein